MQDDGIRLAKRLAEQQGCSRAEAERYIAGGWVTVDGTVVEDPATRVHAGQAVALLPGATPVEPPPVTILLHKPAGVDAAGALALLGADTLAQEDGRGKRFLQRHLARLTLATPLAAEASGLVVFTQDWRVLRKLVDDADRIEHEYVVEVDEQVLDDTLALINRQLKASRQSEGRLRFAGKLLQPGQAAALCREAGLTVRAIRRLRIGRVPMAGLAAGRWRYLHDTERF